MQDPSVLEQLTQLVLSAQIASIHTCSADYLLQLNHHHHNSGENGSSYNQQEASSGFNSNKHDEPIETSNLAKLSVNISKYKYMNFIFKYKNFIFF